MSILEYVGTDAIQISDGNPLTTGVTLEISFDGGQTWSLFTGAAHRRRGFWSGALTIGQRTNDQCDVQVVNATCFPATKTYPNRPGLTDAEITQLRQALGITGTKTPTADGNLDAVQTRVELALPTVAPNIQNGLGVLDVNGNLPGDVLAWGSTPGAVKVGAGTGLPDMNLMGWQDRSIGGAANMIETGTGSDRWSAEALIQGQVADVSGLALETTSQSIGVIVDDTNTKISSPNDYKADVSGLSTFNPATDTVTADLVNDAIKAATIETGALTANAFAVDAISGPAFSQAAADKAKADVSGLSTFDPASDPVDVDRLGGDADSLDRLRRSIDTVAVGTAAAGSTVSVIQVSSISPAILRLGQYQDLTIKFEKASGGANLNGEGQEIQTNDLTSLTLKQPLTFAPAAGELFVIN